MPFAPQENGASRDARFPLSPPGTTVNPPESEGTIAWRVGSVEQAIRDERAARREAMEKLDSEKADAKDVSRLADEFGSLRRTLQWFMGVVATAVIAFAGIVVTLAGH